MKKLPARIGERDSSRTVDVNFLVVDVPLAYNIIIGRPTLGMIKAVIAPYLFLVQYELDDGRVEKLFGDQRMARECYYVNLKALERGEETALTGPSRSCKSLRKENSETMMILPASAEEHGKPHPESVAEVKEIPLDSDRPERMVRIRNTITPSVREALISLLR